MADTAESSGDTPQINYSFFLEVNETRTLSITLKALADPNFGVGMVRVDKNSLHFIVKNATDDTASLIVFRSFMIKFQISRPFVAGTVSLGSISDMFPDELDDINDTVTVFHVQGTDRLCFKFGNDPSRELWTKFVETNIPPYHDLPISFCAATVPSKDLREMTHCVSQIGGPMANRTAAVDIKKYSTTIKIGGIRKWEYDLPELLQTSYLRPGKAHRAWFELTYTTFLHRASYLQPAFHLYFLSDPENHVMFWFGLGTGYCLRLTMKANSVVRVA